MTETCLQTSAYLAMPSHCSLLVFRPDHQDQCHLQKGTKINKASRTKLTYLSKDILPPRFFN